MKCKIMLYSMRKAIAYTQRGVGAVDSAEEKVTKCHVFREVAKTKVLRATQLLTYDN